MTREEYLNALRDPRWQRLRLEVMQRDGFTCRMCGNAAATLNVHHLRYAPGDPWDTPLSDLVTLCEECHEWETRNLKVSRARLMAVIRDQVWPSFAIEQLAIEIENNTTRDSWSGLSSVSLIGGWLTGRALRRLYGANEFNESLADVIRRAVTVERAAAKPEKVDA